MTLRTVLLSSLVAGALGAAVPALADPQPMQSSQPRGDEAAVVRAFRSVLDRDPHPYELRRYARLMDDYEWTEQDVRRDLAGRSDYRRPSSDSTLDLDAIITRAFEDILGHAPDAASVRSQRGRMTQQGWSERDLREDLRQRPEYRTTTGRNTSADRIIRRAYRDILNREPDQGGLSTYRRNIIEDGWDEQDVREVLQRSDERRGMQGRGNAARGQDDQRGGRQDRGTSARSQRDERSGQQGRGTAASGQDNASQIVRNAYLAVLHREPDANGLRDYSERMQRDHWSQSDIEKSLRESQEYKQTNR